MNITRRQAIAGIGSWVGFAYLDELHAASYRFGAGAGSDVSYRFGAQSPPADEVVTPPAAERSPRILYFGAPWCGHCRDVENKTFPELRASGWTIGDATCHIEICDPESTTFAIDGLPAWLLISDGKIQKQMTGFRDHQQVAKWFNDFVKPASRRASSQSIAPARVPSGGRWTHSGGPLIDHCVWHGYARQKLQGLTHGQLVFLHSYAHEHGGSLYAIPAPRSKSRARSAYCPTCPR